MLEETIAHGKGHDQCATAPVFQQKIAIAMHRAWKHGKRTGQEAWKTAAAQEIPIQGQVVIAAKLCGSCGLSKFELGPGSQDDCFPQARNGTIIEDQVAITQAAVEIEIARAQRATMARPLLASPGIQIQAAWHRRGWHTGIARNHKATQGQVSLNAAYGHAHVAC
jgi:hypothetical protein